MKTLRKIVPLLVLLLVAVYLFLPAGENDSSSVAETTGLAQTDTLTPAETAGETAAESLLPEDGSYTTKEDVSQYLLLYGHLPSNFITKREAEKAGWSGGSLETVLPGMCIGGDRFGNYEGLLPKANGRTWTECDINTLGKKSRGAERLVFSNDGLIYYSDDHYDSFTRLY